MPETFNYAHFIPISTVDWLGRSASVVFFRGCQFRCPYCHNHAFLTGQHELRFDDIYSQITMAAPFVSAVVFSGGEPTMQPGALKTLARFVRSRSLAVGLETSGSGVEALEDMLDEGLLDKVFLDIKAPLDDVDAYRRVTGSNAAATGKIAQSLHACLKAGIEVEIRTTVFRGFVGEDEVLKIFRYLDSLEVDDVVYVIQQGIPENTLGLKDVEKFNRRELLQMVRSLDPDHLKDIRIRTVENGDERII